MLRHGDPVVEDAGRYHGVVGLILLFVPAGEGLQVLTLPALARLAVRAVVCRSIGQVRRIVAGPEDGCPIFWEAWPPIYAISDFYEWLIATAVPDIVIIIQHHFGILLVAGRLLGLLAIEAGEVVLLLLDGRHPIDDAATPRVVFAIEEGLRVQSSVHVLRGACIFLVILALIAVDLNVQAELGFMILCKVRPADVLDQRVGPPVLERSLARVAGGEARSAGSVGMDLHEVLVNGIEVSGHLCLGLSGFEDWLQI